MRVRGVAGSRAASAWAGAGRQESGWELKGGRVPGRVTLALKFRFVKDLSVFQG